MWAITAVHVSQSFGAYVLLTELPNYMKNVLHWDLKSKGIYSGLPFLAMTLVAMGSSVFVDEIIKRKLVGKEKKLGTKHKMLKMSTGQCCAKL